MLSAGENPLEFRLEVCVEDVGNRDRMEDGVVRDSLCCSDPVPGSGMEVGTGGNEESPARNDVVMH